MTLDRETARALFDNAEPTPVGAGAAPFAVASAFAPAGGSASYDRMSGRTARKGPDWRLIAPVSLAALCGVAVLVAATQRPDAQPGKTVAAAEITAAAPAPAPVIPLVETAALTPPVSSIVEPPAIRPAPAVRTPVRAEPTRRVPAPRAIAVAPSASEATSDVSAREPYAPPPVLSAPAEVIIVPAEPVPALEPEPQPVTPPQP